MDTRRRPDSARRSPYTHGCGLCVMITVWMDMTSPSPPRHQTAIADVMDMDITHQIVADRQTMDCIGTVDTGRVCGFGYSTLRRIGSDTDLDRRMALRRDTGGLTFRRYVHGLRRRRIVCRIRSDIGSVDYRQLRWITPFRRIGYRNTDITQQTVYGHPVTVCGLPVFGWPVFYAGRLRRFVYPPLRYGPLRTVPRITDGWMDG